MDRVSDGVDDGLVRVLFEGDPDPVLQFLSGRGDRFHEQEGSRMTDAQSFLAAAASEINYIEQPVNRTKFAKEAGHPNGGAWCATFTVAIAKRTGTDIPPKVAATAYTPTAVNEWKAAHRWFTFPEPGDFAYFQFDQDPEVDHVGLVEKIIDVNTVQTIEGNTSSGDHGSQSNGGQVARRVRSRRLIVGYGRPLFTAAAPIHQEDDMFTDADRAKLERLYDAHFNDHPDFGVTGIQKAVMEIGYSVAGVDLPGKPSRVKQLLAKAGINV